MAARRASSNRSSAREARGTSMRAAWSAFRARSSCCRWAPRLEARIRMIEVSDLAKHFGEVKAVRHVTFTAPDGAITGLLGPNGAGKTTTLRMISTLVAPTHGTAKVDGHDAARDPLAVRARIGMLSDARGLYTRLTARENIIYYGALRSMPPAAIEASIARLAEWLDLGAVLDRRTDG